MPATPPALPKPLFPPKAKKIRVATSTYFVIGFVSAMPLIAGIGGLASEEKIVGVLCLVLAPIIFCYFCFQKIDIDCGVMTYCRPFFATQRVLLSSVTEVRTVWSIWSKGYSRRFFFMSGETSLCAFNPKLFSLEDLSFILKEVSAHAPSVSFDEDTRAFLPARAK
jgi:hypothetical protein